MQYIVHAHYIYIIFTALNKLFYDILSFYTIKCHMICHVICDQCEWTHAYITHQNVECVE
jgi:hypothetical protein